ncbi:MAG: hypothetical protein ABEJ46_04750, partial [Gemmatimonadota bacterium]
QAIAQVAKQLQETTGHFEQMLTTLRENPDLEGQWTSREVMTAVTTTGRLSTQLARKAAELSAHLDSLRSGGVLSDEPHAHAARVQDGLQVAQGAHRRRSD